MKSFHLVFTVWVLVVGGASAARAGVVIHDDQNLLEYTDSFLGFTPFNEAFSCNDRMDLQLRNCTSYCSPSGCQETCNTEIDRVSVVSCASDRAIVQTIRPNGQYQNNAVYARDYDYASGNVLRWTLLDGARPLLARSPLGFLAPRGGQVTDAYFDRADEIQVYLRDGQVIPALRVNIRLQVWDNQAHQSFFYPVSVTVGQGTSAIAQQLESQIQGDSAPAYQVLSFSR